MYDHLITDGRICDGSAMPSCNGDVAIQDGKIVELGRVSGSAKPPSTSIARRSRRRQCGSPSRPKEDESSPLH